ncbi:choice-of-anchor G family protein [Cryobacterium sp. Y62]|uniref:choice-of-anchor G family protein n=1 Tax=Cryobacterium sp. Y62 TaxID=2048284 RepID=UPI0011B01E9E|nr:choice-of-anchor G family protein [Cryobacterium sp. Y62]
MSGHSLRPRRRAAWAAVLGLAVVATLLAATNPPTIALSVASWTDTEWAQGSLGTDLVSCGTDTGYSSTASGKFLNATLTDASLGPVVGINGLQATRNGDTAAQVTPTSAQHPDANDPDTTTDTFTNPLTVSVLQQDVLDLTGLTTALPAGAAGMLGEYAQVSNTGSSAGASGLLNNSGGIGFTPTTQDTQLPTAASLNLASVLPAGVASASLLIGAVAASAQLDWCTALESEIWGDGTVSGVVRNYEIASLNLVTQVPVLVDLLASATSTVLSFEDSILPSHTSVVAARALLENPVIVTDTMTVNLSEGTVTMDLASVMRSGLNDQAPNTALGLDATKVQSAITQVTTLVTAWTEAISKELQKAKLDVLTGLLDTLNAALNSLTSVLNTTVTALTPTLNGVFSALPGVLSLTVNVQPDQPNAPTGAAFTAATAASSAEYRVSALRIGLLGYLTGSELATVTFATASAGANARLQ